MPSLSSIPPELVSETLGWLTSDVTSLKNCALTCSALLPVCEYYLFAVVDFTFLDNAEAEPFRDCITEIQATPKSEALESHPEAYIDIALGLPKLKTICFRGVPLHGTSVIHTTVPRPDAHAPLRISFATVLEKRLPEFTSVTNLVLCGTSLANVEQLRSLISSLTNLTRLTLRAITIQGASRGAGNYFMRHRQLPEQSDGPRLTYLSATPGYNAGGTTAALEWLARTPTRGSLRTIEVPAESRNTLFVVGSFGASVHHITIARLDSIASWKMAFIRRYPGLRSLELGCLSQTSWQPLYKMVAEIRSPDFRELVLRYDAIADADATIAPNSVETSPVDYTLHVKLPGLRRVCFVIEHDPTAFAGDVEWKERVTGRVRACFRRLAEAGKLQVEFEDTRQQLQLTVGQMMFRSTRNGVGLRE